MFIAILQTEPEATLLHFSLIHEAAESLYL